jgi:hypothetical protein
MTAVYLLSAPEPLLIHLPEGVLDKDEISGVSSASGKHE